MAVPGAGLSATNNIHRLQCICQTGSRNNPNALDLSHRYAARLLDKVGSATVVLRSERDDSIKRSSPTTGETIMHLDADTSAFIEQIYASAYDEAAWETMALRLLEIMGCRLAFISTVNTGEKHYQRATTKLFGEQDGDTALGAKEYFSERYKDDLTLSYAAAHPHERFCDSRQVYPAEGYLSHPYIQWNKSRFKATHWIVGYSISADGLTFGVSLLPPASLGPLPEEKAKLFRLLFDHMDRAVRLAARPPSLDAASDARVFLGGDGRVIGMSPRAEGIVSEGDGLLLRSGYLEATSAASTDQLRKAIDFAAVAEPVEESGSALTLTRSRGREWLIVAAPLLPGASPSYAFQPKVLVRIIERDAAPLLPPCVLHLFQFTPREAEVAALLLGGHSPESAADQLSISRNTVRVHLTSIFKKTATSRQSELARLLTSLI